MDVEGALEPGQRRESGLVQPREGFAALQAADQHLGLHEGGHPAHLSGGEPVGQRPDQLPDPLVAGQFVVGLDLAVSVLRDRALADAQQARHFALGEVPLPEFAREQRPERR